MAVPTILRYHFTGFSRSASVSKQSLLLVDGDVRSMRVLEVSLRKAGFSVTTAASVQDGMDKLELNAPDLIISETVFPDGDGFELRRRVRAAPDWSEIPFIFLTAEAAIENKIRGLELGVDDYLTKPIYIKEIVTRINILLQKRQRTRFEERRDGRTRFAGRVSDMPVVDVIQTIEISRKSGVIQFVGERGRQATIYFRDGKVIDAESGALQGEDAVYRLLTWNEGEFEVVFRTVRRREVIATSSQGLLMEGMRRLDEWSRLLEQLPPLTHRFEIDTAELTVRLGDIPDDNNAILRLIDGKRTLLEVIDASATGDLECLQVISRLYFEDMLLDLDHDAPVPRDTGRPMPLIEVESVSPMEDAASGQVERAGQLGRSTDLDQLDTDRIPVIASHPEARTPEVSAELPAGALQGGYRPSSLRLIDEAVAAAQAIEPALFADSAELFRSEDPTPTTRPERQEGGVERGGAPYQQTLAFDDPTPPPRSARTSSPSMPAAARPVTTRPLPAARPMIGSLGKDRAEASGELGLPAAAASTPLVKEPERELVTILPRRVTRELAVPSGLLPSDPTPPRPSPAVSAVAARPSSPMLAVASNRPATAATTKDPVRADPGAGRELGARGTFVESSGPGALAIGLFALAAVIVGLTVFLIVQHRAPAVPAVAVTDHDASVASLDPAAAGSDASEVASVDAEALGPEAAVGVVHAAIVDAATANVTTAPDAATASVATAPDAAVALDPDVQSRQLKNQADAALQDGDAEHALELGRQSVKLHRNARAYLVIAQALQRLDRLDEALAATVAAEQLMPKWPSVYEVRGAILWQSGRIEEAKTAYRQSLALEPTGERAQRLRRLIEH